MTLAEAASRVEPWLTKREIADHLGCSVRTVERLHLPAMRVGGQNRYRLTEVEAFLTHRSRPAQLVPFAQGTRDPAA
jgi:excisionase family DNA binding protein